MSWEHKGILRDQWCLGVVACEEVDVFKHLPGLAFKELAAAANENCIASEDALGNIAHKLVLMELTCDIWCCLASFERRDHLLDMFCLGFLLILVSHLDHEHQTSRGMTWSPDGCDLDSLHPQLNFLQS